MLYLTRNLATSPHVFVVPRTTWDREREPWPPNTPNNWFLLFPSHPETFYTRDPWSTEDSLPSAINLYNIAPACWNFLCLDAIVALATPLTAVDPNTYPTSLLPSSCRVSRSKLASVNTLPRMMLLPSSTYVEDHAPSYTLSLVVI